MIPYRVYDVFEYNHNYNQGQREFKLNCIKVNEVARYYITINHCTHHGSNNELSVCCFRSTSPVLV